jgi:hypothetical protein
MNDTPFCVISLGVPVPGASDNPVPALQNYAQGIERIRRGLSDHGFKGEFISWNERLPDGCPPHSTIPFAFKPFCFEEALARGFTKILWMDSSIVIKRPIDELFHCITHDGYLFFKGSETVGEYCKDEALKTLGISREESFAIPSCRASVMGLDLSREVPRAFLSEWKKLALDNITFPGPKWSGVKGWPRLASADQRVKGHRHDQTAASVLAMRMGMDRWKKGVRFRDYFDNDRPFVRRLKEYHGTRSLFARCWSRVRRLV